MEDGLICELNPPVKHCQNQINNTILFTEFHMKYDIESR